VNNKYLSAPAILSGAVYLIYCKDMWRMLANLFLFILLSWNFAVHGQLTDTDFNLTRIKKIYLVNEHDQSRPLAKDIFKPLNLFVFLSPECPLCKNYTTVLNKVTKDFPADSLAVIGIVSGKAYSSEEVNSFRKEFSVNFQLYIDPGKKLTNYLEATITPEVVLINEKGKLIYRGAIDDWVTELGKNKIIPQKEYLKQALTQYINHETVAIKKTKPKGCYINEY
jgi:thiol-disulfide isomerase/thioredoxin